MRRAPRFFALVIASLIAVACTEATTSTEPAIGSGQIRVAPSFSPAASRAFAELSAFGLEVTNVRVLLTAPDGSTRDTVIAFPAGLDTLRVELSVPLRTAGQSFRADLELRNAEGQVLFSGTQQVVAQASNLPGGGNPASITIQYTGPGRNARTVTLSPAGATITGAGTLPFTATAVDNSGGNVTDLLVRWTTSDVTLATVTQTGNASATLASAGRRGVVTLSAITPLGVTGTTQVSLVPVASRVVVVSGGGQTGQAGSQLAQPLVVEVQAADGLPVAGAPVTFRAVTSGASVGTTTTTSDATGRASTTMTLGRTAGAYQFEAVSGTLPAVTATQAATPAPAAAIALVSGSGQGGLPASVLAEPLVVRVRDQFGATVSGATVQWTRVTGGGALASATSTTGADGTASNSYTLGTAVGVESIRASLPGVSEGEGQVVFTATVRAGDAVNISGAGDGQTGTAGTQLPKPLTIRVTDAFGNSVPNVNVVWRVTSTTGTTATFNPVIGTTNASGIAETTVSLGSTAGPITITAFAGPLTRAFAATIEAPVSTEPPGTVSGYVYDAVSQSPLPGVAVTFSAAGSDQVDFRAAPLRAIAMPDTALTTGSDGRFVTPTLPGGLYDITFSRSGSPGYVTTTIRNLRVSGNTVAEAVPMVPASSSPGTISGRVLDATTQGAVAGTATLELRRGLNATSGPVLRTTTSSEGANYSFTGVDAGTYTVLARVAGYADAFKTGIAVGATTTSNQNIFVSPAGTAGLVRIVLTWRANPRDLDSYLTGPIEGSTSRFQVWYGDTGNCSAAPFACLDTDVTGGFGPETITITTQRAGRYRYSVNHYSGSESLATSGARVDVYFGSTLAASYSAPSGTGRDWTVFDLEGTTLTSINTIGGANRSVVPVTPGVSASRSAMPADPRDDTALIQRLIQSRPKPVRAPR